MRLEPFTGQGPRASSFVNRGLLPENIPPIISSERLGAIYADQGDRYLVTKSQTAIPATYNATKRGDQRRVFSIPHPLFQRDAGLFFEKNWNSVWSQMAKSRGSASKPMRPINRYRAVAITPQSRLPNIRVRELATKKYCLVTDVSRCYPSIYTHAIPWALHSKSLAKGDRSERSHDVWGNRLDFILRQSQDGQTIGIPVGPDISRLTAEIILSKIDSEYLQSDRKRVRFVRHVDDYWIGGDSIDDCESILNKLREGLNAYQLDINESKTRIVELSHVTGEYWPDDLARQIEQIFPVQAPWDRGRKVSRSDVQDLFSRAINIVNTTHDSAILKFLIRKMDRAHAWQRNWRELEPYIAHIAVQFPHVFDYVARVVAWGLRDKVKIDRPLWREVIGRIASKSAQFGRDGELLWSLWLYKELGYKIPRIIMEKALTHSGALPLAYSVHLQMNGLVTNPNWTDSLVSRVAGVDQYRGSDWPIVLELFSTNQDQALVAQRALDGSMIQKPFASKSSIVRWDALPQVFSLDVEADNDDDEPRGDIFMDSDFAIEDFTSSYDDEDEEPDEDDNMIDDDEIF